MLVLSRKQFETILIGNDIVITVCQAKEGRVKIGVEAPAKLCVLRGELVRHTADDGVVDTATSLPPTRVVVD